MSRPSPQEQAEIDAASEPRDCRKCARCYDVLEGASVRCTSRDEMGDEAPVPWNIVTGMPCQTFRPVGASPPVSADREGTDALDAMRKAADSLDCLREEVGQHVMHFDDGDIAACDYAALEAADLRRAISSEEARRERPDPRDATIRDLRERLANVEPFEALHADLSEQIRAAWDATGVRSTVKGLATLADVIATDRKHAEEDRALLGRMRTALEAIAREDHDFDRPEALARAALSGTPAQDARNDLLRKCATTLDLVVGLRMVGKYRASGDFLVDGDAYETTHASAKAALAALRAAGVEPTPEAQEVKAKP